MCAQSIQAGVTGLPQYVRRLQCFKYRERGCSDGEQARHKKAPAVLSCGGSLALAFVPAEFHTSGTSKRWTGVLTAAGPAAEQEAKPQQRQQATHRGKHHV